MGSLTIKNRVTFHLELVGKHFFYESIDIQTDNCVYLCLCIQLLLWYICICLQLNEHTLHEIRFHVLINIYGIGKITHLSHKSFSQLTQFFAEFNMNNIHNAEHFRRKTLIFLYKMSYIYYRIHFITVFFLSLYYIQKKPLIIIQQMKFTPIKQTFSTINQ